MNGIATTSSQKNKDKSKIKNNQLLGLANSKNVTKPDIYE